MDEPQAVETIARELAALGVRRGGVLLMHASLSSLGHVPGGPETVLRGLLAALGPEGTLLLPALSYQHVTRAQPLFDVRHTPSNIGAIPEYFRTRPGTRRSVHPTHSVCGIGPQAEAILRNHRLDDTPVGPHSPFRQVPERGGQLLFLGCGLRPNTSMHGIEELAAPPYLLGEPLEYRLILEDGREVRKVYRPHSFSHARQRYDRVEQVLDAGTELRAGPVLQATAHLLDAQALWHKALATLRSDPLYFVDVEPGHYGR